MSTPVARGFAYAPHTRFGRDLLERRELVEDRRWVAHSLSARGRRALHSAQALLHEVGWRIGA